MSLSVFPLSTLWSRSVVSILTVTLASSGWLHGHWLFVTYSVAWKKCQWGEAARLLGFLLLGLLRYNSLLWGLLVTKEGEKTLLLWLWLWLLAEKSLVNSSKMQAQRSER